MSSSDISDEHRAWVAELADPRTRRAARQKLVTAGAVEPLLECLKSHNESVVWAAVESLGDLHATQAVGPLVGLLGRGRLAFDVCEALTRITGQNFGTDAKKWREWMSSNPDLRARPLDVADCMRRTAELLGVEPAGSSNTYQLKLSLPHGRSQKVAVLFGRQDSEGDEIVLIYSECGPANPKHYETLLRKNLTMPGGAFAIREVNGQAILVVVETTLVETVTPGVLAKKIENIAARADAVEKQLAGEDVR